MTWKPPPTCCTPSVASARPAPKPSPNGVRSTALPALPDHMKGRKSVRTPPGHLPFFSAPPPLRVAEPACRPPPTPPATDCVHDVGFKPTRLSADPSHN